MELFGSLWEGWTQKIEKSWRKKITADDLVLLAGDLSWAMRPEEALHDLLWVDSLPGTKVIIKGNHDYWWQSISKVRSILPPSIHALQNSSIAFHDVAICGTRLWDAPDFSFGEVIEYRENPREKVLVGKDEHQEETVKIWRREIERLKIALESLPKNAPFKIVMTHYPPLGLDFKESAASELLEAYGINVSIFGHLHNVKKGVKLFGNARGVDYILTACDFLDFDPVEITRPDLG